MGNETKPEVTLETLMDGKNLNEKETAIVVAAKNDVVKQLNDEDRGKVEQLKDEIDFQDTASLTLYGNKIQKDIGDYSGSVLSQVKNKDSGELGEQMTDLVEKLKGFDSEALTRKNGGILDKIPFLKKARSAVSRYIERYETLERQVDKVEAKLQNAKMALLSDVQTFDKLYEVNLQNFKTLQLHIIAGQEKVADVKTNVLPRLLEEAKQSNEPMATQVVSDYQQAVNRFEKHLHDMNTSATLSLQMAPQIRLIQNNDNMLAEKCDDIINTVIPAWKSQMIIALGLNRQTTVLEMQKSVEETTNELLTRNAEKLHQTTVETAKRAEESTISVETLRKVNQELIDTIQESMRIQQDAQAKREQAAADLAQIRGELKNALVEAAETGAKIK